MTLQNRMGWKSAQHTHQKLWIHKTRTEETLVLRIYETKDVFDTYWLPFTTKQPTTSNEQSKHARACTLALTYPPFKCDPASMRSCQYAILPVPVLRTRSSAAPDAPQRSAGSIQSSTHWLDRLEGNTDLSTWETLDVERRIVKEEVG
jgi:hypothetical protein